GLEPDGDAARCALPRRGSRGRDRDSERRRETHGRDSTYSDEELPRRPGGPGRRCSRPWQVPVSPSSGLYQSATTREASIFGRACQGLTIVIGRRYSLVWSEKCTHTR